MTLLYFEAGIMDCLHICVSKITQYSGSSDTMPTLRAILVVSAVFIIYLVTFIFQAALPAADRRSSCKRREAGSTLMCGRLKHSWVTILWCCSHPVRLNSLCVICLAFRKRVHVYKDNCIIYFMGTKPAISWGRNCALVGLRILWQLGAD